MAIPTKRFCPKYEFKAQIIYANKGKISADVYGINVPATILRSNIPAPKIVNTATMNSKASHQQKVGMLTAVGGLVVPHLKLRFPDIKKQWKSVGPAGPRSMWYFQGGDVYFDLTLEVYILETFRPNAADPISKKLFGVVMEHELLHVHDEIDVVKNWLPKTAYQDKKVKSLLSDGRPLGKKDYEHWIVKGHLENWLKGTWVPERNRRASVRDSKHGYAPFRQRIDNLRIKQTNG
jgi:hypothetical protein